MKTGLLKFLKKMLLFVAILFLVDRAAGAILGHFFHKISSTEAARISYAVNEAREDVIIFGSSRANHHYVPTVFEDSMHLACFNAGIDGEFIVYHDCVLKCILKRTAPKVIILDVNPDEFSTKRNEEVYSELGLLLPYYNSHEEIDSLVNLKSKAEKYKVYSDMYRYNSLLSTIAINNIMKKKDTSIHGYCPLYRKINGPQTELDISGDTELDSLKLTVFKSFIKEAQAAGSKLYIFISPSYLKRNAIPNTITSASRICQDNHVPFFDFSRDTLFVTHPEYFSDASHLNDEGARLYSKMVYAKIKKS
jgi:hypothetical protein